MNLIDRAAALLALKTLVTELVDDGTKEFRLSVCEGCDRFDHEHRRCKVCKCYVDAKVQSKENYNPIKLRHEITYCPKGRWNDKELADFYNKIDGGDADSL